MTQQEALDCMLSGANVFLTGEPGAGKTYTLDKFVGIIKRSPKHIAVTASTGIAASQIGGTTIHSWSGLGIKDSLTPDDMEKITTNGRIIKRYKTTDILVIDEVSMLHGFRLDMVNEVAKKIRNNTRPFGGLQVILVGDMFQLPPITRGSTEFDFVHLSQSWQELELRICYITEQHRQAGQDDLLELLQAMRGNYIGDEHKAILAKRMGMKADVEKITRLYSHNADVDAINSRHLAALPGKIHKFRMSATGRPERIEALKRNILAPEVLEVKEGAEVMFVANNFDAGYVNGSRGKVTGFSRGSGYPIVELQNGRQIHTDRQSWQTREDDYILAEVEQVPLRLAWAITIHKSQGMSLDAAEIDLSKAFTPGMGYVALSRVRSIEGLYMSRSISGVALKMHQEIYDLDAYLRQLSDNPV